MKIIYNKQNIIIYIHEKIVILKNYVELFVWSMIVLIYLTQFHLNL